MIEVTTRWDTIDGVKKKVFMIRGDEGYARSTDTEIIVSDAVKGGLNGIRVNITVNVYRAVDTGTLILYDNDEVVESVELTHPVTSYTWSNVYFAYGVEHNFRAVYKGNNHCLGSKSKTVTRYMDTPNEYRCVITGSVASADPVKSSALGLYYTVKYDGNPLANTDVDIMLDGEDYTTLTTNSSGIATGSLELESLKYGEHTVTAEVDSTSSLIGTSKDDKFLYGAKIIVEDTNKYYYRGSPNEVHVKLVDYNNNPINNATVRLTEGDVDPQSMGSATTNNSGKATIVFNPFWDDEYFLWFDDYNGVPVKSTSIKVIVVTVNSIESLNNPLIVQGNENYLSFKVNGEFIDNIPVNIYENNTHITTVYTNANGVCDCFIKGIGKGEYNITAECMGVEETVTITDYKFYYTIGQKHNFDNNYKFSTTNNYCGDKGNQGFWFGGARGNTLTFLPPYSGSNKLLLQCIDANCNLEVTTTYGSTITIPQSVLKNSAEISITLTDSTLTVKGTNFNQSQNVIVRADSKIILKIPNSASDTADNIMKFNSIKML